MTTTTSVPGTVRAAGVLVSLQGLAGVAFGAAVLIGGTSRPGFNVYGSAGYFAVIFGGVLACGIGLLLGKRWARGPATVIQILLLGVAIYATGPSDQPLYGLPVGALSVVVLVLLFREPSRRWAEGHQPEAEE